MKSLLALAAALGSAGKFSFGSAFKPPRIRISKRYPEQSSRQAMRGSRRAQGGPGIELVNGQYVPRA
jgi:hypothetical protein